MAATGLINFNIGFLGHVDSGKTTLARSLSNVASTAAFDKNPQSRERGITLDLGFSSLQVKAPPHLIAGNPDITHVQLTLVDCPGHASLIRTVMGGAQIIDLMVLVIDALKGVQTQTAECIVIGEMLRRKLVVAINKIDMLEETRREALLRKLNANLRKTLGGTAFGPDIPIYNIAAKSGVGLAEFLDGISAHIYMPKRNTKDCFLLYVDHCFSVKGQGTVCTGTVIQGAVRVNDNLEIPAIGEQRKVKAIQMFHRPVQSAVAGDRIGVCVTQFNSKLLERGLLAKPGYLKPIYAACILLRSIRYFKLAIKSKSKFHVTVGHETVIATVTLFRESQEQQASEAKFDVEKEYEFLEEIEPKTDVCMEQIYALLKFEVPILAAGDATLIASKLDMEVHGNCCRLAFWGNIEWVTHSSNVEESLVQLKVFKRKQKRGLIQRVVNEKELIVRNLFTKAGNRDVYVGKKVKLSTGEEGVIESTFGQGSKVKIRCMYGIKPDTMSMLKNGKTCDVIVELNFKKYIFNKHLQLKQ